MTERTNLMRQVPRRAEHRSGSPPSLPQGREIAGYKASEIRRLQRARGESPCFRTDAQYTCQHLACVLAAECRRRVAAWKR